MKMNSKALIEDLRARTLGVQAAAQALAQLPLAVLNRKASAEAWSVLECLEHLNQYGDYYLPELRRAIAQSKAGAEVEFKSSWLGNYFANSVADKPVDKLNKMKTFKDKNPVGSKLDEGCLQRFLAQQAEMLAILDLAQQVSLTKTKTGISLTRWIRLRLGDTLRVVIYHNERHLAQAKRAVG